MIDIRYRGLVVHRMICRDSPVVAYRVTLESGIDQLREFELPASAYSCTFAGPYLCAQIDLRKERERELAAHDENSTSSGIAEPYAR